MKIVKGIEYFVNETNKRSIEIKGIDYLRWQFDPDTIMEMILNFTLIPQEHLRILKTISFQKLEYGCGGYDYDKKTIFVSYFDLAPKAIVHEIGHLVHLSLKETHEELNFQADYDFLCKFYYQDMGTTPPGEKSIWPEGIVRETFAVMYQMYMTEPERLRSWINGKEERAISNYLFMKNVVFSAKNTRVEEEPSMNNLFQLNLFSGKICIITIGEKA